MIYILNKSFKIIKKSINYACKLIFILANNNLL